MKFADYIEKTDDFDVEIIKADKKYFLNDSDDAKQTANYCLSCEQLRNATERLICREFGCDAVWCGRVLFCTNRSVDYLKDQEKINGMFAYTPDDTTEYGRLLNKKLDNPILGFNSSEYVRKKYSLPGDSSICRSGVLVKSTYIDHPDFREISAEEYEKRLSDLAGFHQRIYISVPYRTSSRNIFMAAYFTSDSGAFFSPVLYGRAMSAVLPENWFDSFCSGFLSSWATEVWVFKFEGWDSDADVKKEIDMAKRLHIPVKYTEVII